MARAPGSRVSNRQISHESQAQTNGQPTNQPKAGVLEEAPAEKSARELKLEKLLFGDPAGFLGNLEEPSDELAPFHGDDFSEDDELREQVAGQGNEDEDEDENGLAGLADEQLFALDTAGDISAPVLKLPGTARDGATETEDVDGPAWEDSDDERLSVSLASHNRLRKLRLTEAEDVVNGKEYIRRLRHQFERLHPMPDWAQPARHRKKRRRVSENQDDEASEVSTSEDEEMEDEISATPLARLLQSSESLTYDVSKASSSDSSRPLRSGTIDMQRLRDVGDPQPSTVESLSFHPTVSPPLILSSGPSGVLSMHHISSTSRGSSTSQPTHNPLLTSLFVRGLSVSTSSFHPSGSRIFFGGRRRYFHIWDLPSGAVSRVSRFAGNQETQKSCERFVLSPCGRYMALVGTSRKGGGCVNILDASTSQWIAQARVEGRGGVIDLAWWADGEGLVALGKSGEVIEFSVQEKRVIARWKDEGAVGSTVVALGGHIRGNDGNSKLLGPSRWVAVGSQSGIVNVYDRSQWTRDKLPGSPSPRKVLEQLVTPTSMLGFSPDGQMLVMASRWKKDALRLVHLPSCTVYKNWPTSNTPLGRVSSIAWAPNSKLLAVGNEAGKIRLFEVRG